MKNCLPILLLTTLASFHSLGTEAKKGTVRAAKEQTSKEARKLLSQVKTATGDRTIFFVRISTPDSTHKRTLEQYQNKIFSTNTTSFKTQYEACSFGKLRWSSAGGADVMLDEDVSAYTESYHFVEAATRKLEKEYGYPYTTADNVIFCAPPNEGTWKVVGGVNDWQVILNYGFCNSLSALMKGIGHNLGLSQSGEGSSIDGDETDSMGMINASEWGPKRCFNGAKNNELGWYSDRVLSIWDPSTPTKIRLTAFVDYDKADPNEPVIIKIADTYYLQYNRAKGINSSGNEKKNEVTVTEGAWGSDSNLVAGLSDGESFTVENFQATNKNLVITACWKGYGSGLNRGDVFIVAIGYDKNWCW